EQIKAAGFPTGMSIEPIRYEFHQPPLYYALLAPIYGLAEGRLIALRLVSVLLGAGIVVLAYAIGRRVWPFNSTPALAAAAFVAFLPQHLATVSQVGNDVLAELLLASALYVLCCRMQEGRLQIAEGRLQKRGGERRTAEGQIEQRISSEIFNLKSSIALGFLLGLILITKTTAYIALPLAAGVLLWQWRRERAGLRAILAQGAAVFLPAALIALPWYARNISIYGWPDFLGLQRHDAIVVGQLRAAEFIAQNSWPAYWQRAVEWTFKSFWGVFGWMGVWLDSRVYFALALLSGLAVAGLGLRIRDRGLGIGDGSRPAQRDCGSEDGSNARRTILAVSALFTFLAYVWYNTQFLQHQGRYLFTALIPIALAFAAGWDAAVRPGAGRWLAGGLVILAAGLVVWGVLAGAGLPKWPVAMTMAAAVGAFLFDLALTALARRAASGHPAAGWAFRLLRTAALVFPHVFLAIVALYALFGVIVPQLS
ncbi:MAG: glycosyltransferase family 39 protein, partial [Anaerolineae bacterium]|nr:glycosyltransferase family 39 protein [Anaerolineae bacterium]